MLEEWSQQYSWDILPHIPYSYGLAPSDFHPIGPMNLYLAGERFTDDVCLVKPVTD